jgi:hypothetical protein
LELAASDVPHASFSRILWQFYMFLQSLPVAVGRMDYSQATELKQFASFIFLPAGGWHGPCYLLIKQRAGVADVMTMNAQTLPVQTWQTEPELKVVPHNGDKPGRPTPKRAAHSTVLRRERRELEVLGWAARVGRLVSLSRGRG